VAPATDGKKRLRCAVLELQRESAVQLAQAECWSPYLISVRGDIRCCDSGFSRGKLPEDRMYLSDQEKDADNHPSS
jgi:hypothetical protein